MLSLESIIAWMKRLVLLDWLVVLMLFLCILIIFVFGVTIRGKKVLSLLCFLVMFCLILSTPIIVQIFSTQVTKKVTISLNNDSRLHYQNLFYIEGTLTNDGKVPISTCTFETILIPANMGKIQRLRYEYLNTQKFTKTINIPLEVGQSQVFSYFFPDPSENKVQFETLTKADCF